MPLVLPLGMPLGMPLVLPLGMPLGLPLGLPLGMPLGMPLVLPLGLPLGMPKPNTSAKTPTRNSNAMTPTERTRYHYHHVQNAKESFAKGSICSAGAVVLFIIGAVAAYHLLIGWAIACGCAVALCWFGAAVNFADYRKHDLRAWLTRPQAEDYE